MAIVSPDVRDIVTGVFVRSTQAGPARESATVARALGLLQGPLDQNFQVDIKAIEDGIDEELPFRDALVFHGQLPRQGDIEHWAQTVRWLYQQLLEVDACQPGGVNRIQVLLAAWSALDVGSVGLEAIAETLAATRIAESAKALLDVTGFQFPEITDSASATWVRKVIEDVKEGKFGELEHALRALRPGVGSDTRAAVSLLWRLKPEILAQLICTRDSLLFSLVVCQVLEGAAPVFALRVENVPFKFVSLPYMQLLNQTIPEFDAQETLTRMLVQVASTTHWRGWLVAAYRHPHLSSIEAGALATTLAQLEERHWADFVEAVDISTARGSAEAFSETLSAFASSVGHDKARPMWELAFRRWNSWDYNSEKDSFFLSSPLTCSFDFPVSMYYAHMAPESLASEEAKLADEVENVEQKWFSSESAAITERNRLASRLRLVKHGRAIAAEGAQALPPRVQADSEFVAVRYRFFDANAALRRVMGG